MQTSGTFPGLSDGRKKTIVAPMRPAPKPAPKAPAKPASSHRAGGHAKHARGGR